MPLNSTCPHCSEFPTDHPEYKVWSEMKQRCFNTNCKYFHNYGGRGITVCDSWRESFVAFIADIGHRPSSKHTLERRDNDGPYSPENCCWDTRTAQGMNRRSNRLLTFGGVTMNVTQWAEHLTIARSTIFNRLFNGWSVAKALSPVLGGASVVNARKTVCIRGHEFKFYKDGTRFCSICKNMMRRERTKRASAARRA